MNRNLDPLPNRLQILQINIKKSQKAHLDLINRALGQKWDLILIQEPYITFLGHICTPNGFTSVFPQDWLARPEDTVHSVIWVNSELSSNSWKVMNILGNNNMMAIQLKRENRKLMIINIYNAHTHSRMLTCLHQFMQEEQVNIGEDANNHIMWCSNFNRHHHLWDDEADKQLFTPQATREADILIGLLAEKGLEMALLRSILTLKHMVTNLHSWPDNVWCSPELIPLIIQCDMDNYLQPLCTNHYPIITIINIPQDRKEPQNSLNYRFTDWDDFRKQLVLNLETIPLPNIIENNEELQQAANDLTDAIQRTIKDRVPVSKPCLHSKRWWNNKLRELKKKFNRLSCEAMRFRAVPHHPCHTECREGACAYSWAILEAKHSHWTNYLEEASDSDLWNINCYLKASVGDGGKMHIPSLKIKEENGTAREITANEGKAEAFHKIFFPQKPAESSVPKFYLPRAFTTIRYNHQGANHLTHQGPFPIQSKQPRQDSQHSITEKCRNYCGLPQPYLSSNYSARNLCQFMEGLHNGSNLETRKARLWLSKGLLPDCFAMHHS